MALNELEEKGLSELHEDTSGLEWTQQSELVEDLKRFGYDVKVVRSDFVVVTNKDLCSYVLFIAKNESTGMMQFGEIIRSPGDPDNVEWDAADRRFWTESNESAEQQEESFDRARENDNITED